MRVHAWHRLTGRLSMRGAMRMGRQGGTERRHAGRILAFSSTGSEHVLCKCPCDRHVLGMNPPLRRAVRLQ